MLEKLSNTKETIIKATRRIRFYSEVVSEGLGVAAAGGGVILGDILLVIMGTILTGSVFVINRLIDTVETRERRLKISKD